MLAEPRIRHLGWIALVVLLLGNLWFAPRAREAVAQLERRTAWPDDGGEGVWRVPVAAIGDRDGTEVVVEVADDRMRVRPIAVDRRDDRSAWVRGIDGSSPVIVDPPSDAVDGDPVRVHR